MKQTWLCINRQDKERRILIEDEAFKLDKRMWSIKVWTCTSGHERPAISNETKLVTPLDFTAIGTKCEVCGSYHHIIADRSCNRPLHIRFN